MENEKLEEAQKTFQEDCERFKSILLKWMQWQKKQKIQLIMQLDLNKQFSRKLNNYLKK